MTLSEAKGRSFRGVAGMGVDSEASCSLVLLMLITLDSVRERPSIRRARLLGGVFGERDGPATGSAAVAKEKISDRSLAGRCEGREASDRGSSGRIVVVTERAKDRPVPVEKVDP